MLEGRLYFDSSDDEEPEVINRVQASVSYKSFLVKNLVDLSTFQHNCDVLKFEYNLGLCLQHLSDRFFRHTEIGEAYKNLKLILFQSYTEKYEELLANIKRIIDIKDLLTFSNLVPRDYLQIFNHLFDHEIPLPEGITVIDDSYKELLKSKIRTDTELLQLFHNYFPFRTLELIQSQDSLNASEILAFSKIINRYCKNELKIIALFCSEEQLVDSVVNISFHGQFIRNLSESWVLRPKSMKASNKIVSLTTYKTEYEKLCNENKEQIIDRIAGLINNRELVQINIEDMAYADKLAHWLFVSELSRNKAAVFTNLMFLKLLKISDINIPANKKHIIDLYPMSAEGAMQASRDLINEEKLHNCHNMDFGNELPGSHKSMLQSQGRLWVNYDYDKLNPILAALSIIEASVKEFRDVDIEKTINNLISSRVYYANTVNPEFNIKIQELEQQMFKAKSEMDNRSYRGEKKALKAKVCEFVSTYGVIEIIKQRFDAMEHEIEKSLCNIYHKACSFYGISGFELGGAFSINAEEDETKMTGVTEDFFVSSE